ncbi:MAG TPA: 30S ribosomal protein S27ae [Candidatus Hodarchaeales archaeon]|nr:30S ribosomal protein S27ae [Candidatus Hodarchaeales archaeon]
MPRQQAKDLYTTDAKSGKVKRKNAPCPRCEGAFLAEHKTRRACGKCGYIEYKK